MPISILPFEKLHGAGNDFVVVHQKHLPEELTEVELAKILTRRHFSIGADGLIIAKAPTSEGEQRGDFAWSYLNSDGSYAQMCGNGIRCLARYLFDRGLVRKKRFSIETLAGLIHVEILLDNLVQVEMGAPIFQPEQVPLRTDLVKDFSYSIDFFEQFFQTLQEKSPQSKILQEKAICTQLPLQIKDKIFRLNTVSLGNPHCVIFLDSQAELESLDLRDFGSQIEENALFPEKTNVEFVYQEKESNSLKIRVWERGSGETLACGTGACAAAIFANLHGRVEIGSEVKTILPGGTLLVRWELSENKIYLSGEAESVFLGQVELQV